MKDAKNKVLSGLIWKFSERISAQVVTFIVSVILARLLPTEAYGLITLVTIFITFANCIVTNGFGSSLIQKKDATNTDFSTVLYFQFIIATVIYILLFLTGLSGAIPIILADCIATSLNTGAATVDPQTSPPLAESTTT